MRTLMEGHRRRKRSLRLVEEVFGVFVDERWYVYWMAPRSSTPHLRRLAYGIIAERLLVVMLITVEREWGNSAVSAGKRSRSIL